MSDQLQGCRLRLERAHEHLTRLDAEIGALPGDEDRSFVGYFDREASEYVFCVEGDPLPLGWGIIVGEFAHNLRALLDNLVYELVVLRGGTPRSGMGGSGFPILQEKGKWDSRETRAKLAGLTDNDRAIIKEVQPFHLGFDDDPDPSFAATHPLAILDDLNNADKHRYLHPAFVAPHSAQPVGPGGTIFKFKRNEDVGPVRPTDIRYVWGARGEHGTEVMRIRLREPGPNPEMEMEHKPALLVSLSNGNPFVDIGGLKWAYEMVKEQVFDRFAPAFGN